MNATRHVALYEPRLPRRVLPEWLDALPATDPNATRSRRDLYRINRLMGARPLLARALDKAAPAGVLQLVELGAGDGSMMLRLAQCRTRQWPDAAVTLLDLQPVVSSGTLASIRGLGWSVEVVKADILDWIELAEADHGAVVFANLFVHHFDGDRLARLLGGVAGRCRAFVCFEPRRSPIALVGSRLLGLIGCNAVTRHDAVRSVHAGFREQELSSLWRSHCAGHWRLEESNTGLFGHLFIAIRDA